MRQLDYGNECKELKFGPRLYEENLSRAEGSPAAESQLPWKRQRFTHFLTKHGKLFKLQKVGSARRVTHLVQSPFYNARVSLLAGPTFLRKHFARFPFNKNSCLKFRKIHVPSGTVHSSCADQTKATGSLVIVLVGRIQLIGPGENNFVKWKGTFWSDRPDQI